MKKLNIQNLFRYDKILKSELDDKYYKDMSFNEVIKLSQKADELIKKSKN